jgi:hypothetical protein
MTLKEFAFAHRLSYRTAKRMLRDGRLRRVPGPLLRGFDVEPLSPCVPLVKLQLTSKRVIVNSCSPS